MRKSPAEMIGLKPFKSEKLKKFEMAQRLAAMMERNLKEAKEKARLAEPYKRSDDAPGWDTWLG